MQSCLSPDQTAVSSWMHQSYCGMHVDSWVPNIESCSGDGKASGADEPSHPPASVNLACSQECYLQRSGILLEKSLNNQLPRTDNWCLSAASLQNCAVQITLWKCPSARRGAAESIHDL